MKEKTKISLKQTKGITLISLVITIIVLLILAGVSIAMLTGENGILTQATKAGEETARAEAEEKVTLAILGSYDNTGKVNEKTMVEELFKEGATKITGADGSDIPSTTTDILDTQYPIKVEMNGYEVEVKKPGETSSGGTGTDTEGLAKGDVAGAGGEEYTDPDGKTVLIPEGGKVSTEETEDSVNEGLVMVDTNKNNNEWVWVEVPQDSINSGVTSSTDYTKIEENINSYTSEYKTPKYGNYTYSDEYRANSGVFTSEDTYNTQKNAVLKSIYEKEGFWVSRYEVGNATVAGVANTPVSGYGATIYININKENSQTKAESMNLEGTTGSLMFGFQWDLILKFMEIRGSIPVATLNNDSTTIGNYTGTASNDTLSGIGTAGEVGNSEILNINDIAGNVWEWTLETNSSTNFPAVNRGGDYDSNGSVHPASYSYNDYPTNTDGVIGFRSVLY